jgi:glycosyltransferase involved in cell wall biosynthesis
MVDIVAVSHACVLSINRSIYHKLLEKGWKIELVIPKYVIKEGKKIYAHTQSKNDPPLHQLELVGTNPRMYSYAGLIPLLENKRPKILFLDIDPLSRLAFRLGKWCEKNQCMLVCLSCENLSFRFRESIQRMGISKIPAILAKLLFNYFSVKRVNHLFTINEDGTNLFLKEGYKKVTKIPLGINSEVFYHNEKVRKEVREQLGVGDTPLLAYFGRMVPEKGIHILLDALKELENQEWYLLLDKFEGKNSGYYVKIESEIENSFLKERVKYFSADHFEIANYMNASDVAILPSVSTSKWVEQYGRVIPESMACGNLVIGSNVGAIPELLGNAGLVFNEKDFIELARLIKIYLDGPKSFQYLKDSAIKRAQKYLSLNRQSEIMNKVFIDLINQNI